MRCSSKAKCKRVIISVSTEESSDSSKYSKHILLEVSMQYSSIISHYLSPLERRVFMTFKL